MNIIRVTNKTLIIGFFALFLQYGAALLMLPFIVKYMNSEQVGFWSVFMADITEVRDLIDCVPIVDTEACVRKMIEWVKG